MLSDQVDTVATLQAYQNWRTDHPDEMVQLGLVGSLPVTIHAPMLELFEPGVIQVRCPRSSQCLVCEGMRSSYVFRWCSKLWLEDYMNLRRAGSWRPGHPEGPHTSATIVNSRGYLVGTEWLLNPAVRGVR